MLLEHEACYSCLTFVSFNNEMTTLSPWTETWDPEVYGGRAPGWQTLVSQRPLWEPPGLVAGVGVGAWSLRQGFSGGWGKCGVRRSGHRGWGSPASARGKMRPRRWPYVSFPAKLGNILACWLNPWKNRWRTGAGASLMAQWLRVCLAMQRFHPGCAMEQLSPWGHNYWSPHAESPCSPKREAATIRRPCIATRE